MPTLSGLDIKREIVKTRPKDGECRALVAGFVRSCMTLSITRTDRSEERRVGKECM